MRQLVCGLLLMVVSPLCMAAHAVLLVSLGMPDEVLKAYFKQSERYSLPLVIRGLYTATTNATAHPVIGSFKDTAMRVKALLNDNSKAGVSINPVLFQAFDVQAVPALVVYNDDMPCLNPRAKVPTITCGADDFDVVYGNVSIKQLLELIAEGSNNKVRAQFAKKGLAGTGGGI